MREIRFRGMTTNLVENEFVYGYYQKIIGYGPCDMGNIYHFIVNENDESNYVDEKTVGEYIEILDAFEGDLLHGCETDEYNAICSSWIGEVKFNDDKGRIMVFDKDVDEWFEVDDFMFDKIIGNVHEVKK